MGKGVLSIEESIKEHDKSPGYLNFLYAGKHLNLSACRLIYHLLQ